MDEHAHAAVAEAEATGALDGEDVEPPYRGRDAWLAGIAYLVAGLVLLGPLGFVVADVVVDVGLLDQVLLGVLTIAMLRLRRGPDAITVLVRRPARPGRAVALAGAAGLAGALLQAGIVWLWEALVGPTPVAQAWIADELGAGGVGAALMAVTAVVVAPASEETFFRGVLFGGMRFSWGFWPAALVSSAVFAVLHVDVTVEASVWTIGLALPWALVAAAIYQRFGLWAAIAFHAANNAVALVSVALGW